MLCIAAASKHIIDPHADFSHSFCFQSDQTNLFPLRVKAVPLGCTDHIRIFQVAETLNVCLTI
jgi:hypothetical protein